MARPILPPDGRGGVVLSHHRRLLEQERKDRTASSTADMEVIPFGVGGAVATGKTPKTWPPFSATGVGAILSLETASSSGSVTARLLKNGSAVTNSSISLAASATASGLVYFAVSWVKLTDYFQMEVTAAGTGASLLNYDLYFRRT